MTERNTKILMAAECLFARYGVGKTTMNDIAREAGVARQTLYNAYPGKDEVLRATVKRLCDQTSKAITDAWRDADTLEDKLEVFFEFGPLAWYDLVQSSPDVAELLDGMHTVAREEIDRATEGGTQAIGDLLRSHAANLAKAPGGIEAVAEFIYSTAINAKHNSENRQVLKRRLAILKASVLAMAATAS